VTATLLLTAALWPGTVAEAAPNIYQLAGARDLPVTSQGQTFFTADVMVRKSGDTIIVSGANDSRQPFYVDDILDVTVTRPDGTVARTAVDDSNGCTADTILTTPATNVARFLQAGWNKVHVEFRDACGGDYGNSDIYLGGTAEFAPSLPTMDGGTFVLVRYPSKGGSGEACTSGFSVQKNGKKYMLTAKHCFDGNLKNDDQATNANIGPYAPLIIRTSTDAYTFATQLNCLAGPASCLLPPNKSVAGDMVAFRPDIARPTNMVQTGQGLMRVFGELPWTKGQQLCHYGFGIGTESCGPVTVSNRPRVGSNTP
jgi:hypothetical protein